MFQRELTISPNGRGLYEITEKIQSIVSSSNIEEGLCNVFIKHSSASLLIQENASKEVLTDILNFFDKIVPEHSEYLHSIEGPDDMPSHLRSILSETSLVIPVKDNHLDLGVWQGIFLFEHRQSSFNRKIFVSVFD